MTLEQVTEQMRQRIGVDSGLNATAKFDFGSDGVIFVDATRVPNVVSNEDADAQCTLRMPLEDFLAMIQGELDATTAFMMGKLKVDGDMSVAMHLQSMLG